MHDLDTKLTKAGWTTGPIETGKWIKITDSRPEFRKHFQTDRVGKIQDGVLYVTVGALGITARTLMSKYRLPVIQLQSTSGRQKDAYPGFDLASCPDEALELFLASLRAAVDIHLDSNPVRSRDGL